MDNNLSPTPAPQLAQPIVAVSKKSRFGIYVLITLAVSLLILVGILLVLFSKNPNNGLNNLDQNTAPLLTSSSSSLAVIGSSSSSSPLTYSHPNFPDFALTYSPDIWSLTEEPNTQNSHNVILTYKNTDNNLIFTLVPWQEDGPSVMCLNKATLTNVGDWIRDSCSDRLPGDKFIPTCSYFYNKLLSDPNACPSDKSASGSEGGVLQTKLKGAPPIETMDGTFPQESGFFLVWLKGEDSQFIREADKVVINLKY